MVAANSKLASSPVQLPAHKFGIPNWIAYSRAGTSPCRAPFVVWPSWRLFAKLMIGSRSGVVVGLLSKHWAPTLAFAALLVGWAQNLSPIHKDHNDTNNKLGST